ncbi:protein-disulfide reductase DsbD domain-containing protein [Methyloceanibacter sp. wino2]|uniref:protein-disulfide reductase DsbD domain-containing protein n=1 Tax=Methyloceanibacter sp. wino2 TaxID=2170729 RepID=UPI00131F468B|nr:protein-disulfide reductase DsbD domain-containing protein [Methyloceanibacter sp. wino2]
MRHGSIRRPTLAVLGALLCWAGLAGVSLAASSGQSAWSGQGKSKVRLVSGLVDEDGKPSRYAGVQLRMEQGWKTYWRNPGDSGVPPSFDWSGSKNVKSIEVFYPVPHRFADANGTAIGYDDEVVFPVRVTPEQADKPVQLSLTFDYGLCKDLCIPNSVDLRADLPADLGKGDARLIEQAMERVPAPAGPDTLPRLEAVTAYLEGDEPTLEVEALFAPGATHTDLFITSSEILVPVPKALGPLTDGRQRFSVVFPTAEEGAAIKGKPLIFTLVSDQSSSETTRTEP